MPLFVSRRERFLWACALAAVAATYATLGLARALDGVVPSAALIGAAYVGGLALIVLAVAVQAWRVQMRGVELGVALALVGVLLVAATRLTIPDARTHLIEYAVVGLCVYEALRERADHGGGVPHPAWFAFALTTAIGLGDEALQAVLPGRVFDPVDLLFNALAAAFAVGSSASLAALRRRRLSPSQSNSPAHRS